MSGIEERQKETFTNVFVFKKGALVCCGKAKERVENAKGAWKRVWRVKNEGRRRVLKDSKGKKGCPRLRGNIKGCGGERRRQEKGNQG